MVMKQIDSIIKKSKNILIASHINPDGDTLGSMCAMYHLIKDNYKKNAQMVIVSKLPETYEFLPQIQDALFIENMDLSREYDLVINVDIASIDRCNDVQTLFKKAKNTINIDHHETNNSYAEINIIDPHASATGEIIYEIAQALNWQISKECAIGLYTAILTDTGGFKFSNTSTKTMEYSAQIMKYGIDSSDIYRKCYESQSKNMVLFQCYCVNKAEFTNNDKIAYTTVYKKDLEKFNNNGEDYTDGLTEKLRAINTTEIAFVVKELNAATSKVSMRSKNTDIAKICSTLGGGGHKFAAGAVIKANVNDAVKLILKEIEKLNL